MYCKIALAALLPMTTRLIIAAKNRRTSALLFRLTSRQSKVIRKPA